MGPANTTRGKAKEGALRGARAYTLVEMLVVIALMLLLLSLVVAGLADMVRSKGLHNSVQRVAAMIGLARNRAISENSICHVRVENRGPNDQWISVYQFPKVSDALLAVSEKWVQESGGGWNTSDVLGTYRNRLIEMQKLEPNTWYETQYDPALVWQISPKERPASSDTLHGASSKHDLYYSGKWAEALNNPWPVFNPDADTGDALNLLPKLKPASVSTYPTPHQLLFFYPDGTASANVLLLIRDEQNLSWVEVWKGGSLRTGEIINQKDLTALYQP